MQYSEWFKLKVLDVEFNWFIYLFNIIIWIQLLLLKLQE